MSSSDSGTPRGSAADERHDAWIEGAREQHAELRAAERTETAGRDDDTWQSPSGASSLGGGLAPDSIAGYQILSEIHRGGQGIVYQALQKSTNRTVAIKVLREGAFAGPSDRARFEREVRILAALNHPNIVTVHDSGNVAGHSFLVMDYIAGTALNEWNGGSSARKLRGLEQSPEKSGLRSARSAIPDTLRLFAKICEAVNVAHLRGVIHRDLKPGNIRVDPSGEPHVLDFGLAKVGEFDVLAGSSDATMTEPGQFVGSLYWASPEQAEGAPDKIDLRTDVYSLGVILYDLLTGRFPYDISGHFRDVLGRILHDDPIRPRTLRREIDDEVETIVLKCLAKERERRYQSAGELARDVRRYLANEPIEAKRDSGWYVLRKTLRRHRVLVGVGAAVALVLMTATIVSTVLWRRAVAAEHAQSLQTARAERALAAEAQQRGVAEQHARETKQVADFQSEMLRSIDTAAMGQGLRAGYREQIATRLASQWIGEWPNSRPRTADEITAELAHFDSVAGVASPIDVARRLMDQYVLGPAVATAQDRLSDQPLVQAQIHHAIGRAYKGLGLFDASEQELRTALDLRRRHSSGTDWETGDTTLWLAQVLESKGEHNAAEQLFRAALGIFRELEAGDGPGVASCLMLLGASLHAQGGQAGAEPLLREALAMRRRLRGDQHIDVCLSKSSLARLLVDRGEYEEAEQLLRECLAFSREHADVERRTHATNLSNLASLLHETGQYAEAEALQREGLALTRELVGNEHADVVTALNSLASTVGESGRHMEAEALLREALALSRKTLVEEELAVSLGNLAATLCYKGDYAAAEPLYREALALVRTRLGDQHPYTASILRNLGALLLEVGERGEAERTLREALAIRARLFGLEHRDVAILLHDLADLLADNGDSAESEQHYRQAVAVYQAALGNEHPEVALTLNNLATLLKRQQRCAEAEPLYRQAVSIMCARPASTVPDTRKLQIGLADCLIELRRWSEAEALLLSAGNSLIEDAGAPPSYRQHAHHAFVALYDALNTAEPGQGHDAKATEWRARLAEWQASTQPAAQPAAP